MYIFELLYKTVKKVIQKRQKNTAEENETECEHVFLPIDSTKKTLACTKCGFLVKAGDLKLKPNAYLFTSKEKINKQKRLR